MKKNFLKLSAMMIACALIFTSCAKDEDTTKPVITVTGGTTMTTVLNATFVPPVVTATDDTDGDLTSSVKMTGTVNKDLTGDYVLTYSVADAAGNTDEKTVTVHVVNSAANLAGNYSYINIWGVGTVNDTVFKTDVIAPSSTINNAIVFQEFGSYSTCPVIATVTGTTISVASQTFTVGSPAAPTNFISIGTNTINGTSITINYNETVSGTTTICKSVYIKQ
ncbi:MAG: immunoglobulin-like domain-containing protein [Bacteroidota bacterium]